MAPANEWEDEMSRALNIDSAAVQSRTEALTAKQRFGKAASLWRAVMYLAMFWAGAAFVFAVATYAGAITAASSPSGEAGGFSGGGFVGFVFWISQIPSSLLMSLAAWTFHLFAKDKADSF